MRAIRVEIETAGGRVACVLPKEMLDRLGVADGGVLWAIESERGIELTALPPTDAVGAPDALAIAEDVMREDGDVLRRLAE